MAHREGAAQVPERTHGSNGNAQAPKQAAATIPAASVVQRQHSIILPLCHPATQAVSI